MHNAELEAIWQSVQNMVATYEGVDPAQAYAFLPSMRLQAFNERGFAVFTANSSFIKKWIEMNYVSNIERAFEGSYGNRFAIQIEVDEAEEQPRTTYSTQQVQPPVKPLQEKKTFIDEVKVEKNIKDDQPLLTRKHKTPVSLYSFDNFVKGASNSLAYSMSLAVAETPGDDPTLNPLFIYGKSGLGKTHLLRAIQNYICDNIPELRTVYVDSMELVNDYTNAAAAGRNDAFIRFKARYENADVLLIDDVQSLQNKNETINMVFQILNRMIDEGKQVILAADRAPKNIDIEERYQSRFNSGGTCNVNPPEFETKLGIIRNFIGECNRVNGSNIHISTDIQEYIAQNSSSNIRELKSAITKVMFMITSHGNREATVREVEDLLQNHFSGGALHKPTIIGIQKVVGDYYGVSQADLIGKKRTANIAHARKIAVFLCRTMIDSPYSTIGDEFNRDHATIMYSVKNIENQLGSNRDLNEDLEILTSRVREG